jgi:hypothetical protein
MNAQDGILLPARAGLSPKSDAAVRAAQIVLRRWIETDTTHPDLQKLVPAGRKYDYQVPSGRDEVYTEETVIVVSSVMSVLLNPNLLQIPLGADSQAPRFNSKAKRSVSRPRGSPPTPGSTQ